MEKREFLKPPVVSAGADFLVIGNLKKRNILAYTPGKRTVKPLLQLARCVRSNPT